MANHSLVVIQQKSANTLIVYSNPASDVFFVDGSDVWSAIRAELLRPFGPWTRSLFIAIEEELIAAIEAAPPTNGALLVSTDCRYFSVMGRCQIACPSGFPASCLLWLSVHSDAPYAKLKTVTLEQK